MSDEKDVRDCTMSLFVPSKKRGKQLGFRAQTENLDNPMEETLPIYLKASGLDKFDCDFEVCALNPSCFPRFLLGTSG